MGNPREAPVAFPRVSIGGRTRATQLRRLLKAGMHVVVMQDEQLERSGAGRGLYDAAGGQG